MIRTLRTAATGMQGQQLFVDTISNNLANVNTTAFKRNKIDFQDLLYQTIRVAGSSNLQNTYVPAALHVGNGVRPVSAAKVQTQGDVYYTNNPLDIAVDGDGFLQVIRPDGRLAYTRDGSLKVSENSVLGADILGRIGKRAEEVGKDAALSLRQISETDAVVDVWMVDQVIPYMALAACETGQRSRIRIPKTTKHAETNIWVVEQLLPVKFSIERNVMTCRKVTPEAVT